MICHQQQSVHKMLPVWSHMGNENWCMSGYHGVSVLSDAIVKGVYTDTDSALKAMVETSTVPYYSGLGDYMKLGYVPLDKDGTAASSTLEYAYDDWTIYNAALKAGREWKFLDGSLSIVHISSKSKRGKIIVLLLKYLWTNSKK